LQNFRGSPYNEAGEQEYQSVMSMAVGGVGLLLARSRGASLSSHIAIRRSVRGTLGNGVGPLGPSLVGVCAPVQYHIAWVSEGSNQVSWNRDKKSDCSNQIRGKQLVLSGHTITSTAALQLAQLECTCAKFTHWLERSAERTKRQTSPSSSANQIDPGGGMRSGFGGQKKKRSKMRGAVVVDAYR
jgi:hypothetical protein